MNSSNNTIGGESAQDRNVISANGQQGILVSDSSNNVIMNNYIGTDVDRHGRPRQRRQRHPGDGVLGRKPDRRRGDRRQRSDQTTSSSRRRRATSSPATTPTAC